MARAQCSKALCSLIPLSRKRRPVFHLSKQAKACQHVDAHRASRRLLCKCLSFPPFTCRWLLSNLAVRRKCFAANCLWASCENEQHLHVHGQTRHRSGSHLLGNDSSRYSAPPIRRVSASFKNQGHCRLHCWLIINEWPLSVSLFPPVLCFFTISCLSLGL